MSQAFSYFIAIVALGNIAAILWLIWWTARGSAQVAPTETTHVWDTDLTEYNNPLPRWWLWMFLLTIAFGLAYLAWYPGLGAFKGFSHWTQISQYSQEAQSAQSALEQRFAGMKDKSLLALSKDPSAMATAKNLFALNCSTCHGSDARGAKAFPNLTDQDWLWGGSEEAVYQTIAHGRDAAMPAWGPVLQADGVEKVTVYVLSLSGRSPDKAVSTEMLAAGKATFATMCSACHGADGKGNPVLGAPNLTDKVWLHGGSIADIRESITNGRINKMPAHEERLGETRVRLLAAYVLSLSQPAEPAPDVAQGPGR